MSYLRIGSTIVLVVLSAAGRLSAEDEAAKLEYFENNIRPVFAQQCLSCHSGERPQAGLSLDHRGGWEVGGKSGPAIVRGDPAKSLVVRSLRHEDGVTPMPLGGDKLPPQTIAAFEEWIRTGAFDPREKSTAASPVSKSWEDTFNERRKWWSLQPVSRPPIPAVRQASWSRQALDRFLLAKMEAAGLAPASPADRATLLRRLSFVLTGLPPTPEELDAFLTDRDPKAYEKLVARLLSSVHFGEHWARHWMDVVRYSDTYGYESDIPAKGAWRYRDYLIRAFNEDVPFDQLVREQIAGDLLPRPRINAASQINESLIGTMFYQMGEKREGDSLQFNGIHQEMVNNKIDAFSKAFQAMTVGCARCHDHKLDAISQRDYYAMAGEFMSSRWVSNTLDTPERNRVTLQRLAALKPKIHEALAQWWLESVGEIPKRLEALVPEPEKEEPGKDKAEKDKAKKEDPKEGKKAPLEDPLYIWFELKAAQAKSESVADAWRRLKETYAAARKQRMESNSRDYVTVADLKRGVPQGWSVDGVALRQGPVATGDFAVSLEGSSAVHMLMPAGLFTNSLSPRLNGVLRTPFLNHSGGKKLSIQAAGGDFSTVSDIVDNAFMTERQVYLKTIQPQWTALFPVGGQSGDMPKTEEEKAEMRICAEIATKASNPNFPPRIGLIRKLATLEQERDPRSWFGVTRVVEHSTDKPPEDELARFEPLFAGDPPADLADVAARFQQWAQTAIEAWRQNRATDDHVWIVNWLIEKNLLPNNSEERERVRLLVNYYRSVEKQIADPQTVNGMVDVDPGRDYRLNVRGVYEDLGERVPRGYVEVLAGKRSGPAPTNSGRLELAQLVATPTNPLTARVFVNRVWSWVFGTGLVATTDDFGHLGEMPSHPELLDYLANQFTTEAWSVKKLVQSLVLSETFRQSGRSSLKAHEVDPLDRLLSHYPLRRLEAESIRDSVLAVSSRLAPQLFGETIDPPRTKEDADKRLFSGPLDGNGRRSIYIRMSIMEPPRFLASFNQPSPKVPTGRRDKTNSPAQALALLNDPFVAGQAEFWAKNLIGQPHRDPRERLTVMFRRAFGRNPEAAELALWTSLAHDLAGAHYGDLSPSPASDDIMNSLDVWKDLAHTMFNAKEFIYVQ